MTRKLDILLIRLIAWHTALNQYTPRTVRGRKRKRVQKKEIVRHNQLLNMAYEATILAEIANSNGSLSN